MKINKLILSAVIILISVLLIWFFIPDIDKPPVLPSSLILFEPEITHSFSPDSTIKKQHIFRISPGASSEKYAIKVEFSELDANEQLSHDELKSLVRITDYGTNSIDIPSSLFLTINKRKPAPRYIIYSGYFNLSENKHYRVDFTELDILATNLEEHISEVTYSIGILRIEE